MGLSCCRVVRIGYEAAIHRSDCKARISTIEEDVGYAIIFADTLGAMWQTLRNRSHMSGRKYRLNSTDTGSAF